MIESEWCSVCVRTLHLSFYNLVRYFFSSFFVVVASFCSICVARMIIIVVVAVVDVVLFDHIIDYPPSSPHENDEQMANSIRHLLSICEQILKCMLKHLDIYKWINIYDVN